jgi:hypothetical protein
MMGDVRLKYATLQLLMKFDDRGSEHYIFFVPDGMKAEYLFDQTTVKGKNMFHPKPGLSSTFRVKSKQGTYVYITTLTEQLAMDAMKIDGKLLITSATVLPDRDSITLLSLGNPQFRYISYPSAKGLRWQTRQVESVKPQYEVKEYGTQLMTVAFHDSLNHPQVHEYFLNINYKADVAMAFLGGELITDDFWHDKLWTLALNRFRTLLSKEAMTLRFRPLRKELNVKSINIQPEYRLKLKL